LILFLLSPIKLFAQVSLSTPNAATSTPSGLLFQPTPEQLKTIDSDNDGLNDYEEIYIYHTNLHNPDTDNDGYSDGIEVKNSYDPNKNERTKIAKSINVDLKTQTLTYFLGTYGVGHFLISSGIKNLPTPPGEYQILKKLPTVRYKGLGYDYPNTKWNLLFKQQKAGNLYIHGSYWHHNFGHPMSHGCVNVSYANMESLYNWADVGTKVTIK
jgi:lipoprotein-anchoring transpeptidase ErfK/SrfK